MARRFAETAILQCEPCLKRDTGSVVAHAHRSIAVFQDGSCWRVSAFKLAIFPPEAGIPARG